MSKDIIKDLSDMEVSDDQWVYECAQRAVNEIKRRDAENARLKEKLIRAKNRIEQLEDWNRIQTATWAASDREVGRLREALEKIATTQGGGDCCSAYEWFVHTKQIARTALAEKEKK